MGYLLFCYYCDPKGGRHGRGCAARRRQAKAALAVAVKAKRSSATEES